jgi:hypothetical protein
MSKVSYLTKSRDGECNYFHLWNNELSSKKANGWQCTIGKKRNRGDWINGGIDICKSLEPF